TGCQCDCRCRLLKDALNDPHHGPRYEHILGALLSVVGKGLRQELEKQTRLTQLLGVVAERVREANGSGRQVVLQEGMERVQLLFRKNKIRLPLNPSMEAKGLNVKQDDLCIYEEQQQDDLCIYEEQQQDDLCIYEEQDDQQQDDLCIYEEEQQDDLCIYEEQQQDDLCVYT
ncbi:unnamed protein product, partial [Ranitomeya imitator]